MVKVSFRSQGFTIVEVMIVIAIMSIVALGIATLMSNITTSTSTQKANFELNNLHEEIRSLLSTPSACQQTFVNTPLAVGMNVAFPAIKNPAGVNTYVVGNTYGDNAVRITRVAITAYRDTLPTYGVATLGVDFTPIAQVLGSQVLHREIMLQTQKSPGNLLITCIALSKMSDGIWQTVPLTTYDSFYAGGNVGIGTASPTFPLDVQTRIATGPVLTWGDTVRGASSTLSSDQGGAIELGSAGPTGANPVPNGTPFIDFHFGKAGPGQDSNMRIINAADGSLAVSGTGTGTPKEIARFVFTGGNSYYLGVGTTTPAYTLDVNGDANLTGVLRFSGGSPICGSTGCVAVSDIRLKEDIKPLDNSLDQILKLQGISYSFKDKVKYGKAPQIGLSAQDLEKVYPQVVATDPKSGLKSVAYDHLIAPIIESLKSLYGKIVALEKRVQDLYAKDLARDKELAALKSEVAQIKRENAELKANAERINQTNAKILERLKVLEDKPGR